MPSPMNRNMYFALSCFSLSLALHPEKVAVSEKALSAMGFSDFRVRVRGGEKQEIAWIQVPEEQILKAARMHREVTEALKPCFHDIVLDLKPREGVD